MNKFSREYFDLMITFAEKVARIERIPIENALAEYTMMYTAFYDTVLLYGVVTLRLLHLRPI